MDLSSGVILLLLVVLIALQLFLLARQRKMESRLEQRVDEGNRHLFNQFESYQYLRDRLNLREGMPYTRDWSASPDFLKVIVEHSLKHKPEHVVECSSGLTTVMLARCCELNGKGKVVSLENGAEYAANTREQLAAYELQQMAEVIHAPLQPYHLPAGDFDWYAIGQLPNNSIDMLVIDGPPGFIQKHSRYPALPLLLDKMADGCTVFMDDAARPDEKEIVAMWQQAFPGVEHQYLSLERGCSVLTVMK